MVLNNVPFICEGKIIFPEGDLVLDSCTLAEIRELLDQNGSFDPELPVGIKHLCFEHCAGRLVVFFQADSEIESHSMPLAFDYIPKSQLLLSSFLVFYKRAAGTLPWIRLENDQVITIFSLNLHLTSSGNDQIVESISFLTTSHIMTCSCEICQTTRRILANQVPAPSVTQTRYSHFAE